jgi:hypothetical protein
MTSEKESTKSYLSQWNITIDLTLFDVEQHLFQHKALGQALFDEVCRHLNLLESDYFGLEFLDCYNNHVRRSNQDFNLDNI